MLPEKEIRGIRHKADILLKIVIILHNLVALSCGGIANNN